jgi:hypothetical protein
MSVTGPHYVSLIGIPGTVNPVQYVLLFGERHRVQPQCADPNSVPIESWLRDLASTTKYPVDFFIEGHLKDASGEHGHLIEGHSVVFRNIIRDNAAGQYANPNFRFHFIDYRTDPFMYPFGFFQIDDEEMLRKLLLGDNLYHFVMAASGLSDADYLKAIVELYPEDDRVFVESGMDFAFRRGESKLFTKNREHRIRKQLLELEPVIQERIIEYYSALFRIGIAKVKEWAPRDLGQGWNHDYVGRTKQLLKYFVFRHFMEISFLTRLLKSSLADSELSIGYFGSAHSQTLTEALQYIFSETGTLFYEADQDPKNCVRIDDPNVTVVLNYLRA